MPDLNVHITGSFRGASPMEMERTITVSEETLGHLFPPGTSGEAVGWPRAYRDEAVRLVCAILKDAIFQDEITAVETLEDLKRLGTNRLHVHFETSQISASVPLIEILEPK